MERPSDTPFFVGKNANERHGLRLIHGRAKHRQTMQESTELSDQEISMIKSQNILEFLEKAGLGYFDIDKSNVDTATLQVRFNSFLKDELDRVRGEDDEEHDLINSMSFSEVVAHANYYFVQSLGRLRSMPIDAEEETRESTFLQLRYWYKVRNIVQEASNKHIVLV